MGVTRGQPAIGARIAVAVEQLREVGVAVETSADGDLTTYRIERSTYRVEVLVDPTRWLGVRFDLLGEGGSTALRYGVDTDLYNISLPKYRWFADEIEAEIVLLLEGLAQRRVLVDVSSPKPRMIVPSVDGPLLMRKLRFGATVSPYVATDDPAPHGFRALQP
jgi:hypothetical protein